MLWGQRMEKGEPHTGTEPTLGGFPLTSASLLSGDCSDLWGIGLMVCTLS